MNEVASQDRSEASAPGEVLAEFERFRGKLGFVARPAPLIDDRYRLERMLGRGAMGEVHLAHDHRLERSVALKLVRASSSIAASTLRARIEREALALARVAHPNVIGIHDVGTHEGQTYFTMQFVAGATLREWQTGRSRNEILTTYLQAARGLAAAHACGVVHRDFKPDNVIVGDDNLARVLDFGIAAALDPDRDSDPEPETTLERPVEDDHTTNPTNAASSEPDRSDPGPPTGLTRPGMLLGTLPYMASEQLAGQRADARSDQFGFCVALWEALVGKRPFSGRSITALLRSIEKGPEGGTSLPRWLRATLVRGLASEPSRRWPSMDELIAVLERGLARRRRIALGFGLALALTAASLIGRAMVPATELPPRETCETFVATIDPLWGASRREAISAHASADAEASAYVILTLDQLAGDWRTAAAALCEGESAPALDTPERACLTAWLEGFGDHVELLAERGDEKTLAHAPDLLARLVPPDGDYCASRPSRPVDPEVWREAELARATVVLGDIARAFAWADSAVARAQRLDTRTFTIDAAVAHAARAEVAAFGGELEAALRELAIAERHALGADFHDVLLPTWTLSAKLRALSDEPDAALAHVERAEPLTFALHLGEHDPRRAELLEARGLTERSSGRPREAIGLHRQAQELFVAAGQPTLAGKSLINIGASFQDLDEPERAREAYAEAVALFERAGLPPSYRHRIQLERHLGQLAYSYGESEEIAEGLEHFEFVVEHGTASERLYALEAIVTLAFELDEEALVLRWSERALAELDAQPGASRDEVVGIQRAVGIALASAADPRGEPLLETAERGAEALPVLVRFNLQRSWIQWLEQAGRCAEARERRADFLARMAGSSESELPAEYEAWRDAGLEHPCID